MFCCLRRQIRDLCFTHWRNERGYMNKEILIICRGGGDLATGIVHRLFRAGYQVLILETAEPAAIRRQVSFCEAVYEGTATVEGVTAERIYTAKKQAVEEVLQAVFPVCCGYETTTAHDSSFPFTAFLWQTGKTVEQGFDKVKNLGRGRGRLGGGRGTLL